MRMIWRSREPRYDVASGISQGARDYQEDAITADFPVGAEAGFVVLADGMGGHAAGDVASKIVLTEVFSELKFHFADVEAFEARAPEILRNVADFANETLRQHTRSHPETEGMGATLVVPALIENRLWWISIGDSPLFLFRNGKLTQLNEDHSMAPQIDFMVKSGLMDPEIAANHPDRNCLISVLMGTRIPKIDCPVRPHELQAGDIILCASDGVQFLTNAQIEKVLSKYRKSRSTEIAERLLQELTKLDDPDQDNISFTLIKVNDASVRAKQAGQSGPSPTVARPRRLTTIAPEHLTLPTPKIASAPQPTPAIAPLTAKAVTPAVIPTATPAPVPEPKAAAPQRRVVQSVPESAPGPQVEDLSPVRLRPKRVTVIK
jgi:PPM family protein phosphatase